MISQEYLLAIALMVGGLLKAFGVEIENGVLEGLVVGVASLWIAIRRRAKGDIDNSLGGFVFGVKK